MEIQLFFLNKCSLDCYEPCSILIVLIKLILVSFAFVFFAFMDERIFEGPCSTIFTDVLLACYCRLSFYFAVDFANLSI